MYQSPAYWELEKTISHWETIKSYIDLARKLRSMSYNDTLILKSCDTGTFSSHEELGLELKSSLKTDMLKYAADRCEEIAVKLAESEPKTFDIKEACKV